MDSEKIKIKVKELILITNGNNVNSGIDTLHEMVIKYANLGGDRNSLESFLLKEYHLLDDDYKEDLLGEIISRLSGYCSTILMYQWKRDDRY